MNDTATITQTQGGNMAPKKKRISLILCLLGGWFGAHKFYEGKFLMGILYLCTGGLYFVGVIFDLIKLLRSPSVYYVKKKDLAYYKNTMVSAVVNFPLDKIGRFVSGAGGAVMGYGISSEFNWAILLTGLGIAAAGVLLTWLKTHDLKDTLIGNGIIAGLLAVGMFALLFLIGAVIVYFALKVFLGIDLIEWFTDIFGDGQTSEQNGEAYHSTANMPATIRDAYGNVYRIQSYGVNQRTYYCPENGGTVTIRDSDISMSNSSARVGDEFFRW